jgi:Fe-S oxidoreductase
MELIKTHKSTLEDCRYCPMCRHVCSSEFLSYKESDAPRGRAILLYNIYYSKDEYESSVVDSVYNCFLCGCCWSWCVGRDEGGYNIPELIRSARKDIVNKDIVPEVAKEIRDFILKNNNQFNIGKEKAYSYRGNASKAEILYYLDSEISFNNIEIADSVIKILKKLNSDFTVLKDELSGSKLLDILGFEKEYIERIKKIYEQIKNTGCKTILVSDPLSYEMFKNDFEKYGLKLEPNIKVQHISEFLNLKIKENKIKLNKIDKKVTLIDSEYLGRFNNILEEPRNIIKNSAGANFSDLRWNSEKMLSAGEAALIFNSERFNFNDNLAEKFINLAKEVNAELIITLSPTTKNIIKNFPGRGKIEVLDIVEFVEKMSN